MRRGFRRSWAEHPGESVDRCDELPGWGLSTGGLLSFVEKSESPEDIRDRTFCVSGKDDNTGFSMYIIETDK